MKPSNSFQNPMSDDNDKNMNELFQNVKSENYDSSFAEFGFWLNKKTLNNQSNQTMKNSFNLKYFLSHNRLKLAIIVLLLLTIAACNMPVTSTNNLGYLLTLDSPNEKAAYINDEIVKTIDKKYITTHIIRGNEEKKMDLHRIVLENITEQDAQNIQNKISSLPGVSNVKLIPMINSETMPLYSYAMKNIFKVNVNSEGKTDQQVLDEINKQLEDAGYKGAKVSYANIDGKKRLVINEPGNIKPGSNLEINVDGGNTKDVLKIRNFGLDPFVGMTDEEIRNEVKKENPGIEDKDIGIERIIGENGKEEVKVSIEKDEEIRK
jgi:hypothetical protein